MKIQRSECWRVDMPIRNPYTVAYDTFDQASNCLLRLETDTGMVGWGCAAPEAQVTGEHLADVLQAYAEIIDPLLKGADPLCYGAHIETLRPLLAKLPAARAMADMALFDLLGKIAGLPLYQLLGGYRRRIITSITIGILPLADTLAQVDAYVRQGFKAIKLKGGRDVEEDVERVHRVRERIGPAIALRFDANQGYTAAQAGRFVQTVKDANLEVLEQPTAKSEPRLLGRLSRQTDVPVMADESLVDLADALHLAADGLADMINLKLMKVGGIADAMHVCAVARAAQIPVMAGCMDESALGISAGLQLALARANITLADLDGHLDLVDDPTAGIIRLEDGYLYPNDQPGLGFRGP